MPEVDALIVGDNRVQTVGHGSLLYQSRTDTADHIIGQKAFRAHHLFQNLSEDVEREHIEENMFYSAGVV